MTWGSWAKNTKNFGEKERKFTMYKKDAYLRTYEPMIMPMTSENQWMKTNLPPLMPPKYHKQPGRPKKSRNKAADEPKKSTYSYKIPRYGIPLKCGNCGEEGHNQLGCKVRRRDATKNTMALRPRTQSSSSQQEVNGEASHPKKLRPRKEACRSQPPIEVHAS
ncbi:unnamed protein product [Prunus armeniaca]